MKNSLFLFFSGSLLFILACTQSTGYEQEKTNANASNSLRMMPTDDGKWVIVNGKNVQLYEVFLFDNGPDYPSEGLIRVVKHGKIGYADATTFSVVLEPQFDCAFPFENGKAKVSNQCQTIKDFEHSILTSDNWKFVDKRGNEVL